MKLNQNVNIFICYFPLTREESEEPSNFAMQSSIELDRCDKNFWNVCNVMRFFTLSRTFAHVKRQNGFIHGVLETWTYFRINGSTILPSISFLRNPCQWNSFLNFITRFLLWDSPQKKKLKHSLRFFFQCLLQKLFIVYLLWFFQN